MENFESLLSEFERANFSIWQVLTLSDKEISQRFQRSVTEISRFRSFYLGSIQPPQPINTSSNPLSSGSPPIDELLGGGFFPGTVNEVFGSASSGKTCFCCQVALANPGSVYFHSEDPIQLICKRMEDIVAASHDDPEIIRKTRFRKIETVNELRVGLNVLKKLPTKPKVIIIDSMTMVLPPTKQNDLRGILQELGLRKLAFELGCVIVFANQVRDVVRANRQLPSNQYERQVEIVEGDAAVNSEFRKRPYMGYTLSDYIDSRLMLQRPKSVSPFSREAHLIFSRYSGPKVINLTMCEAGLQKFELPKAEFPSYPSPLHTLT